MATSVDTLDNPICEAPVQAQMFETPIEKPFTGKMESYHYAWLSSHPNRTGAWLKARLKEGFHVHHVDGDHSNDAPNNLILIDGTDHMRLHGMKLVDGLKAWRLGIRRRKAAEPKVKNDAGEAIYSMRIDYDGTWSDMAKAFYAGVKPSNKTWDALGHSIMLMARHYARKSDRIWPPAHYRPVKPLDEGDIAAFCSRT